jgi:hypothetical protein
MSFFLKMAVREWPAVVDDFGSCAKPAKNITIGGIDCNGQMRQANARIPQV